MLASQDYKVTIHQLKLQSCSITECLPTLFDTVSSLCCKPSNQVHVHQESQLATSMVSVKGNIPPSK